MENFYSLLCVMGMATWCPDVEKSVDFIRSLPPEIAILILRKLDGKSLVAACRVSRAWWRLCRSDGQLRRKILAQMRLERRRREARIRGEHIVVLRPEQQIQTDVFRPRNCKYAVVTRDVEVSQSCNTEMPYSRPTRPAVKKSKKIKRPTTRLRL